MKVAIFSDLHAHPFKPYATILENGMNSRLADAVSCVDQILQVCIQDGIDLVLFGGDLFHERRRINVAAFNAIYEKLAQFRLAGIPVAMIHGNHDQADKYGAEHSIHAFRTFCTIIDDPGWSVVTGASGLPYSIMGIPYTENVEHLHSVVQTPAPPTSDPGQPKLMLAHLGIQGARVGADFVYANPHDAEIQDLNPDGFDACYFGHYHIHQQLSRNSWYIGAPLQHNWGDRDQWRGFLIYDTATKTHERISLRSPSFRLATDPALYCWGQQNSGEEHPQTYEGDYVRIVSEPWTESDKNDFVEQWGLRSLEIVPPDVAKNEPDTPRIDITPQTSLVDAMETYIASGVHPTDGLEESYLMKIGTEILAELDNDE